MANLYPFETIQQPHEATHVDILYPGLLEQVKQELKEMSRQQTELIDLGEMRGVTPQEDWVGAISLEKRLDPESGDLTQEEVDESIAAINDYFVPVSLGAPKRCVDGRFRKGYNDEDSRDYGKPLGPQVQGGSEGDITGKRLAVGYEEGATYGKDLEDEINNSKSDFGVGGHTGEHADPNTGKTDCGQRDGNQRRLINFCNSRLKTVTTILSGVYQKARLTFPNGAQDQLANNASSLVKHEADYYQDQPDALETIREYNPKAIEDLSGDHKEVTLTINCVPGTTFHRDHYNDQTNGKIQNFNLDAWNIFEEHGEDAFFVLADAVNLCMDLTDGSIKVLLRLPK